MPTLCADKKDIPRFLIEKTIPGFLNGQWINIRRLSLAAATFPLDENKATVGFGKNEDNPPS
jgi:hypothetical protein